MVGLRWRLGLAVVVLSTSTCACSGLLGLDDFTGGAGGGVAGTGETSTGSGGGGGTSTGSGGTGGVGGGDGGIGPCGQVNPPASYPSVVLRDGPIAYWRLGEKNIGDSAVDAMGAHHGTYTSGISLGEPGLLFDDADTCVAVPDAVDQHVVVADDDELDFRDTAPFTLEAWVSFEQLATTSSRTVVQKRSASTVVNGYTLLASNEELSFRRIRDDVGEGPTFATTLTANRTYHIVATYDGTEACLSVDGSTRECVASNQDLRNTPVELLLGAREFAGRIDEVAIYDYALPFDCAADHYLVGTREN